MKLHRFALLAALLAMPFAYAAEEEAEEGPWSGTVTFGYLATSGNTENSNLNTSFKVGYTAGLWLHEARAAAIYADESGSTTSEAYDAGWNSARNLTDQDFLFGRLDWRKDRFSAFNTQFSQTIGYGRRLINTDRHHLDGELGVGARQSERRDGTELDETIFRGGAYYTFKFSETASFSQDLTTEVGSDNTFSESVSRVTAQLIGNLALTASYTIRHNSDVPAGTESTDTFTALSLEYAF